MSNRSARDAGIKRDAGSDEALWWLGVLATIKVGAADTGGQHAIIEMITPTGLGAPPHAHRREEETFVVFEGELAFNVGGKEVTVGPGDVLHVPQGVAHDFKVTTAHPARYITIYSPAIFEGFIRATSEPARGPGMPPIVKPDLAEIERVNALMAEFETDSFVEDQAIVS